MNNRADIYPIHTGSELFYTDYRFCRLIGCVSNSIRLSKVIRKLMEFEYVYIECHTFFSMHCDRLIPSSFFSTSILLFSLHTILLIVYKINELINIVNLIFVNKINNIFIPLFEI